MTNVLISDEMSQRIIDTAEQLALADGAETVTVRKILQALGDANRQHLILEMLRMGRCSGVRVSEIAERTHLSRPAISHHVRILKEAGLLRMRREGTKNYYYFDADTDAMRGLIQMLAHAKRIMEALPDRSGEEE